MRRGLKLLVVEAAILPAAGLVICIAWPNLVDARCSIGIISTTPILGTEWMVQRRGADCGSGRLGQLYGIEAADPKVSEPILLVAGPTLERVQIDSSVPHHLRLTIPLASGMRTYALDIPGIALDYVWSEGNPMPPSPPPP